MAAFFEITRVPDREVRGHLAEEKPWEPMIWQLALILHVSRHTGHIQPRQRHVRGFGVLHPVGATPHPSWMPRRRASSLFRWYFFDSINLDKPRA